jgi:hypothetical protein
MATLTDIAKKSKRVTGSKKPVARNSKPATRSEYTVLHELARLIKAGRDYDQIAKEMKVKRESVTWYMWKARTLGIVPPVKRSAAKKSAAA